MSDTLPVLVAVDGSEGSAAAVRYGAVTAQRLERPLRLLHVAPDYLPVAALMPLTASFTTTELEAVGHAVLDDALVIAHSVLPAEQVSASVTVGDRIPGILTAAGRAVLLVLGDDRTPLIERVSVGTVIGTIAARADVPVVSVPAGWMESPDAGRHHRIVVGVKDYERVPQELLRHAFWLAHEQGAVLELVFAWDVPPAYGGMVSAALDYPGWQAMIDHELRRACSAAQADHPDVEVETSAWHGQPAHILRERSRHADLLLLTRRAHGFLLGHFGSTGRALLRESACPVEVVPVAEIGTEVPISGTTASAPAGAGGVG
jgi:nucleotide-binding universal stress UspA family protein